MPSCIKFTAAGIATQYIAVIGISFFIPGMGFIQETLYFQLQVMEFHGMDQNLLLLVLVQILQLIQLMVFHGLDQVQVYFQHPEITQHLEEIYLYPLVPVLLIVLLIQIVTVLYGLVQVALYLQHQVTLLLLTDHNGQRQVLEQIQ